ncbi:tRNA preQ1(34) S-adenosylmethionine ribosyltransferase-isomerase QueA [Chloroflexota bacterium]
MKTSDFNYPLPAELIAQTPIEPRDQSRLMVLNRSDGSMEHRKFFEITDYFVNGDVLVFNDTRVLPARLIGRKVSSGGRVEILLLRRLDNNVWEALVKPGKRVSIGTRVEITNNSLTNDGHKTEVLAEVTGLGQGGVKVMSFSDETLLSEVGQVPLPPYIRLPLANPERYQTLYAKVHGSVAAPTAGLHFRRELIERLTEKGVQCLFVTLHIGLDTFRPVREDNPLEHPVYREYGVLSPEVAGHLAQAKAEGRRIIAVGTTTVRILEETAQTGSPLQFQPFAGWVSLFILPGYQFRMVDALITNFHLPRSTLLMLVTAFAGKDLITDAYKQAIAQQYRFYSFGDAMLIL